MGWFKRNLFFAIGSLLALLLLAGGIYYDFNSWNRNSAAMAKLNDLGDQVNNINREPVLPGNDQVDNITAAREQTRQLEQWMWQAGKYFQPISPVPSPTNGVLNSQMFADTLPRAIHNLQQEAADASVMLPPDFSFSFTAERGSVKFAAGSLRPLSEQLGEVKAISEILFAAHVNSLDSVQRVRVSDDDASGQQSDYLDEQSVTNDLAVLTPYQVTFRGFSSDIAQVLSALASSPHGFIVRGINVQPAETSQSFVPPPATSARGGVRTLLTEHLLRVTLEIEVVKLKLNSWNS